MDRFGKKANAHDGKQSYCKPCTVELQREYQERKKARGGKAKKKVTSKTVSISKAVGEPKRTKRAPKKGKNGHNTVDLPLLTMMRAGLVPEVRGVVERMRNGGIGTMVISLEHDLISFNTTDGGDDDGR